MRRAISFQIPRSNPILFAKTADTRRIRAISDVNRGRFGGKERKPASAISKDHALGTFLRAQKRVNFVPLRSRHFTIPKRFPRGGGREIKNPGKMRTAARR